MLNATAARLGSIKKILARDAGVGADAKALAEAAVSTWRRVTFHLTPIIGEGGVGSLYARSLHLTRSRFPWLAVAPATQPAGQAQQTDWPYMDLRSSLEQREPAEVRNASSAHLVTFIELLATLLGEPLTARLLRSLWDDAASKEPTRKIRK